MYGDEFIVIMAIMDIFNFFKVSGDGFDSLRKWIILELILYFIFMFNLDGVECY